MSEPPRAHQISAADAIARDHHYVPQALLQRWSPDGLQVYAYRTLVSHESVPEWTLRSIRSSAFQRDLYTDMSASDETDDTERWFATEYERPGLQAIDRVVRGVHLSRGDWECIIRLVALQHLRTPQSFLEAMQRWSRTLPDLLERTTRESIDQLEQARRLGIHLTADPDSVPKALADLINVRVEPRAENDDAGAVLRTEVVLGRRFWLAWIRHILTGVATKLLAHQWSIWEPAGNGEWPLTDDPSLRLNYYGADKFDFGGGWGKRGSELMMPISPRHLVYTQVDIPSRRRHTASPEQTRAVQAILVKRAHRWIFGTEPYGWVTSMRRRVTDRAKFDAETELWSRWHQDQRQSVVSGG